MSLLLLLKRRHDDRPVRFSMVCFAVGLLAAAGEVAATASGHPALGLAFGMLVFAVALLYAEVRGALY